MAAGAPQGRDVLAVRRGIGFGLELLPEVPGGVSEAVSGEKEGSGGGVRALLIRYLRWSSRRHWSVKLMTAVVLLPIWACTPTRAWERLMEDAFGGRG